MLAIKMQRSNDYLINKPKHGSTLGFPTRTAILCGMARCLLTILVENEGNGMIRPSLQGCTMTAFKTACNVSQNDEVKEPTT